MQQSWFPSSNWSSILIALMVWRWKKYSCKHLQMIPGRCTQNWKKGAKGRGTIGEGSTSHLFLIAQTVGSSPFGLFKSGQLCFRCREWHAPVCDRCWTHRAEFIATLMCEKTWFAVFLHGAGRNAKRGEHMWKITLCSPYTELLWYLETTWNNVISTWLHNFETRVFYTAVIALKRCQSADKWKGSERSHFQIQHVAYLYSNSALSKKYPFWLANPRNPNDGSDRS